MPRPSTPHPGQPLSLSPLQRLRRTAAVVGLVALGGCAVSASPDYDARFGAATRTALTQQQLDPQATERNGQKQPPANGKAVREGLDRFVETFRAPPPNNVIPVATGQGGKP